jgi:hypothetical protein
MVSQVFPGGGNGGFLFPLSATAVARYGGGVCGWTREARRCSLNTHKRGPEAVSYPVHPREDLGGAFFAVRLSSPASLAFC